MNNFLKYFAGLISRPEHHPVPDAILRDIGVSRAFVFQFR